MNVNLKEWIKSCEGYRSHPYKDPRGNLTIGWGRNLDSIGLSESEADSLIDNDIARCERELAPFEWFKNQPEGVKAALINMSFNLGIGKLLLFEKMIAALSANDYAMAAIQVLNSNWAFQVGQRAKDVAVMIREGRSYESGTN